MAAPGLLTAMSSTTRSKDVLLHWAMKEHVYAGGAGVGDTGVDEELGLTARNADIDMNMYCQCSCTADAPYTRHTELNCTPLPMGHVDPVRR